MKKRKYIPKTFKNRSRKEWKNYKIIQKAPIGNKKKFS